LVTYVVAAGLTYGQGEEIFHFLFKAAWRGKISCLPVFGDGQNLIPTIHILDLARYFIDLHADQAYVVLTVEAQTTSVSYKDVKILRYGRPTFTALSPNWGRTSNGSSHQEPRFIYIKRATNVDPIF